MFCVEVNKNNLLFHFGVNFLEYAKDTIFKLLPISQRQKIPEAIRKQLFLLLQKTRIHSSEIFCWEKSLKVPKMDL